MSGAHVNLTAPATGGLAGVLIFQDRAIKSTMPNSLSGGAALVLNGTLYFPTTKVVYSAGSASSGGPTVVVADTASFSGSSYLR